MAAADACDVVIPVVSYTVGLKYSDNALTVDPTCVVDSDVLTAAARHYGNLS